MRDSLGDFGCHGDPQTLIRRSAGSHPQIINLEGVEMLAASWHSYDFHGVGRALSS